MCRIFAGQDPGRYAPETRRLRLNGQSTSLRLEAAFWDDPRPASPRARG